MKSLTIISCLVSLITVFFTQFILFLLPFLLPTFPFLALLPLSGVLILIVLGLVKCCKKIVSVKASAPAFVFFSLVFIWAVYGFVVCKVTSSLEDFLFNAEMIILILGLCRIMKSDPGFITNDSTFHSLPVQSPLSEVKAHGGELDSQPEESLNRVRYCKHCKNYILGFDHHCPAFGNCIGQKNHLLFIALLIGFIMSEVSYVVFAFQCKEKLPTLIDNGNEADGTRGLLVSTVLFSLTQLIWQVFFLMWHFYCACFDIKTDEWINWKKYPEFQTKTTLHTGEQQSAPQFVNPYDKGILLNVKKFCSGK